MAKPVYRVPTMAEIRALPPNGLKVISTFSGGGGSSCGYAMAGFKVLWASEFIDSARETYAANFPTTILDGRDIRTVTAEDILKATGLKVGELDVFDGSPPCSAFSTAGKREKGWGKGEKKYSDKKQGAVEDLFFEYARLLKGLQPRAFVAENVSGLVKGVGKGYFIEILKALEDAGYVVDAKLLDAQWLGVPQTRQRLIFVGFRKDLGIVPVHPKPLKYRYTIREVFDGMRIVTTRGDSLWRAEQRSFDKSGSRSPDLPSPSVMVGGMAGMNSSQVRVVHDTAAVGGSYDEALERCKERESRGQHFSAGDVSDKPCPTITTGASGLNAEHYKVYEEQSPALERVVHDTGGTFSTGDVTDRPCPAITIGSSGGPKSKTNGAPNSSHYKVYEKAAEAEAERLRVLFDTSGNAYETPPDITDRPCPSITVGKDSMNAGHYKVFQDEPPQSPSIERFAIGEEWNKLRPGETSEKYFNLVKPDEDSPCPTVTATGGNVGAAAVTHPTKPRKFTIAELRRICSFPDDFELKGSYQQQWERCGRAVPPRMMSHVAAAVRDALRLHDGLPAYDPAASPEKDEAPPPVRGDRRRGRRSP